MLLPAWEHSEGKLLRCADRQFPVVRYKIISKGGRIESSPPKSRLHIQVLLGLNQPESRPAPRPRPDFRPGSKITSTLTSSSGSDGAAASKAGGAKAERCSTRLLQRAGARCRGIDKTEPEVAAPRLFSLTSRPSRDGFPIPPRKLLPNKL